MDMTTGKYWFCNTNRLDKKNKKRRLEWKKSTIQKNKNCYTQMYSLNFLAKNGPLPYGGYRKISLNKNNGNLKERKVIEKMDGPH